MGKSRGPADSCDLGSLNGVRDGRIREVVFCSFAIISLNRKGCKFSVHGPQTSQLLRQAGLLHSLNSALTGQGCHLLLQLFYLMRSRHPGTIDRIDFGRSSREHIHIPRSVHMSYINQRSATTTCNHRRESSVGRHVLFLGVTSSAVMGHVCRCSRRRCGGNAYH